MKAMKYNPVIHARQLLMDFCASDGHRCFGQRNHLMRFTPRRDGGRFNEGVSYEKWLAFYTPLSGGIGGGA